MILLRKFVSTVGVALCVAPILLFLASNAWGQQGTSQSQMLFEMQEMRQEIAELRDMVERQAYQLRQLQNVNSETNNSASSQTFGSSTTNQGAVELQTQGYQIPQAQGSQLPQAQGSQLPQAQGSQLPQAQGSQLPQAQGSPQNPVAQPVQVPTADQVISEGVSSPSYSTQQSEVIDNSAVITQRSVNPAYQSAESVIPDNYPPVEERTIGTGQRAPVYNPETYNRAAELPAGTQSEYNQQPSVSSATPNPNFPTPYQREAPAQLPNLNDNSTIAGTSASSTGIVTIPQAATTNQTQIPAANTAAIDASALNPNANSVGEKTYYQQGFELLKQSQHEEAVTTFKKQISDYPSGEYADDAHYWIAESLYVNRELDQSKLYFKAILDRFEQSPRLPDAMLKTAYIEQEQGNVIEARILLQEIIQFHPRSNAAISAKNRLADLN